MLELLVILATALACKIATDESLTLLSSWSEWLVRRAARKVGMKDCDRYEEEWLAVLADTTTPLRRLCRAIGFYVAAVQMARELGSRRQTEGDGNRRTLRHPLTFRVARWLLGSHTYSRYISPIAADMQHEYVTCLEREHVQSARWVMVNGYVQFVLMVLYRIWSAIKRWW